MIQSLDYSLTLTVIAKLKYKKEFVETHEVNIKLPASAIYN